MWVEAMLDLADRTQDAVPPALRAQALMFGGVFARIQGELGTALRLLETCVAIWRTLDDDLGLAQGLANLGANQLYTGEFEQADEALTESLALARGAGEPFTICLVLNQLGTLAYLRGQHERATEFLHESLTLGRTLERPGDRGHVVGRALVLSGRALYEQGRFEEALVFFTHALSGEAPMVGLTLGQVLDWTAALFGATGEPLRAARLFGAAEGQWLASGAPRYTWNPAYERDLHAVRVQLDDEAFAEALAQGRAMTADQAIAHALRET